MCIYYCLCIYSLLVFKKKSSTFTSHLLWQPFSVKPHSGGSCKVTDVGTP